jgi:hypothetical protein
MKRNADNKPLFNSVRRAKRRTPWSNCLSRIFNVPASVYSDTEKDDDRDGAPRNFSATERSRSQRFATLPLPGWTLGREEFLSPPSSGKVGRIWKRHFIHRD